MKHVLVSAAMIAGLFPCVANAKSGDKPCSACEAKISGQLADLTKLATAANEQLTQIVKNTSASPTPPSPVPAPTPPVPAGAKGAIFIQFPSNPAFHENAEVPRYNDLVGAAQAAANGYCSNLHYAAGRITSTALVGAGMSGHVITGLICFD